MNPVKNIASMDELKKFISKHNIRVVKKKSSQMCGFLGLHYDLNEEFGLRIPTDVVWIDENLRGRVLFRTLKHEVDEMFLMRNGLDYFPAHKIALKNETLR
jgi:hypothetical protein